MSLYVFFLLYLNYFKIIAVIDTVMWYLIDFLRLNVLQSIKNVLKNKIELVKFK